MFLLLHKHRIQQAIRLTLPLMGTASPSPFLLLLLALLIPATHLRLTAPTLLTLPLPPIPDHQVPQCPLWDKWDTPRLLPQPILLLQLASLIHMPHRLLQP